ncbi:MAG: YncE family protein, partial [Acidobacteriota bacterium]
MGVLAFAAVAAYGHPVQAKRAMPMDDFDGRFAPSFQLLGRPIGGTKAAPAAPAYLTASRITAAGDGALVIDADSGQLVRTDKSGKNVAQLAIGSNAGLLAYDPASKLAYVVDRVGNRVVVVKVGDTLELDSQWKTPAEPYGVALSPDRKTALVTTIADRALVAFDTATGKEKWRSALGREPRGIAVSPDGSRALVAYLETGTVDQID